MIEIVALVILAITNIGTLVFLAWYIYLEHKAKNKMINSLVAKTSQDFSNFELSDKMQAVKVEPQPDIGSDLRELSDLTDKEFDEKVSSG